MLAYAPVGARVPASAPMPHWSWQGLQTAD
jgi:hypothetical protein